MREIKFRAWDKEKKEMSSWKDIKVYEDNSPYLSDYFNFENTPIILMQYTGFKDKNGKEIYEGDIIKTEHGATGIVVWLDGVGYKFDTSEPMWGHPIHGMGGEREIIGNIYQNSELLKEVK